MPTRIAILIGFIVGAGWTLLTPLGLLIMPVLVVIAVLLLCGGLFYTTRSKAIILVLLCAAAIYWNIPFDAPAHVVSGQ